MSDLGRIDRNVQAISAIERSWELPTLPDMVKLDIAGMSGLDPDGVTQFMGSVRSEVLAAERTEPVQLEEQPGPVPLHQPDKDRLDRFREVFHGTAGLAAPTKIDPDSNSAFKQRAIEAGYLDPDTPVDNSWHPGLNGIARQMSQDDYSRRIRGDRPGPSQSVGDIAKWMDDWLSPSGLLSAAYTLDLLPDPSQVAKEAGSWGDKWRSWVDNPTDPGKLVDAITGPVDDLVLPIVNVALMVTGVGEVVASARAVRLASQAVRGADVVRDMYSGSSKFRKGVSLLLRTGDPAADILRFQEPSYLASKLGSMQSPLAQGASRGMQAWRSRTSVALAKKTVQQGMRLGVASRLEDQLPSFDGFSAADVLPEVDQSGRSPLLRIERHNPLVWGLGELMFAPRNLFEPGWVQRAADNSLTKVTGLAHVTRNQALTQGWVGGVTNWIEDTRGVDAAQEFAVRAKGNQAQALADELTGGDQRALGAMMSYVTTAAAIDVYAGRLAVFDDQFAYLAKRLSLKDPKKFALLTRARNSAIAKLRNLHPDDIEGALWERALSESNTMPEARKRFESMVEQANTDPTYHAQIKTGIAAHNANRQTFFEDLLDNHMEEGVLEEYLPQMLDTFGRWGDFDNMMTHVDEVFDTGGLDGAQFSKAVSPETNALLSQGGPVFSGPGGLGLTDDAAADANLAMRPDRVREVFDFEGLLVDPEVIRYMDPFAKDHPLSTGRFTVAKTDTPTAQELHGFWAIGRRLRQLERNWRQVGGSNVMRDIVEKAGEGALFADFGKVRVGVIDGWLAESAAARGVARTSDEVRRVRRLALYMRKHSIDPALLKQHIDDRIEEYTHAAAWDRRYGIDQGLDLKAKMDQLRQRQNFTARQVAPESLPEGMADELAARGYKLVYGQEFLTPTDLRNFMVEAEHMSGWQQWQSSLGNFFRRQPASYVRRSGERIRTSAIARNLRDVPGGRDVSGGLSSPTLRAVMDDLRRLHRQRLDGEMGRLDAKRHMGLLSPQRMMANLSTNHLPMTVGDLGLNKHRKYVVDTLQEADFGYSYEEAAAIWKGLKEGNDLGFKHRGLVTIEDHLRKNPNLTNGLRLFGRTKIAQNASLPGKVAANAGVRGVRMIGAGALAGGAHAMLLNTDPDASWQERLGVGLTAYVAGQMGMGAATRALSNRGVLGAVEATGSAVKWADKIDASENWSQYAYLADQLATLRDYARFTLSPIFDASRYSEGLILAQLQDLPADVIRSGGLKFNQSPYAWRRRHAKTLREAGMGTKQAKDAAYQAWTDNVSEFRAMSSPDFEWDTMEQTSKWFSQVGILGYNPTEWMASTYADLRRLGVAREQAYDISRRTYTYGLDGRSAAELSVNFIFFPFSFMKKTLGHASKWMSQDLSRSIAMHDAVKAYSLIDERYDLHTHWRERLPVLERLQRLNLLAYGVSPGELGGPNRPLVNFFLSTPVDDGTINPFFNAIAMPHGISIRNSKDLGDWQQLTRRLLPVWNDVGAMIEDIEAQGHVMFGGTKMTEEAEVTRAYRDYSELRELVDGALKEVGEDGISALNKDKFEPLKRWFQDQRWKIGEKYPAWGEVRAENAADNLMASEERRNLLNRAVLGLELAPHEEAAAVLLEAEVQLNETFGELDSWPLEVTEAFLREAATAAESDDRFILTWRKFFGKRFGSIETRLS